MDVDTLKQERASRALARHTSRNWRGSASLLVIAIAALAVSRTPADAQAIWTGAGDQNWSNATNWDTNTVPVAGTNVSVPHGTPNSPVIDGVGANANALVVGTNSGLATLGIANGGTLASNSAVLGYDASGQGLVTVAGVGSSWTNMANVQIGRAGEGLLRISAGGLVTTDSADLAVNADSSGVVDVDGAGTVWNNTNGLTIGKGGVAGVKVTNGAQVTSGGIRLSDEATSTYSTLTVDGAGSSVTSANLLWVGYQGVAEMTVSNGGALSSGYAELGHGAGAEGSVDVKGNGSTWTNSGGLVIGGAGRGYLDVTNGAQVSSTYSSLAAETGSFADAGVYGTGSSWTNSQSLTVGVRGEAKLTVSAHGTMTSQDGRIGYEAGSLGSVFVQGAGSTWTNSGLLSVGVAGSGALSIDVGGSVSSVGGSIGTAVGGTGEVTVQDAGSLWSNTGSLYVGDAGTGTLILSKGGRLTATGDIHLAAQSGSTGTLVIGAETGSPIAAGSVTAGAIKFGDGTGRLVFNHTNTNYLFATPIEGTGQISHIAGTTVLTGNSGAFSGATTVSGGTLRVDGTLGGTTSVQSGGTLGGAGTLTGAVSVASGGTLLGVQGQTLTMGALTLASGSNTNVSFGVSGGAGVFNVTGNVTLDGTINVSDAGGFGAGVYRIFDYSGSLTDNGLDVGAMPFGTSGTVQTAVATQVNLVVSGVAGGVQFWNGTTTAADGTIHGGSGTWSAGTETNWTNTNGTTTAAWGSHFAVFQGNPGTVTVDGSAGAVSATGMQFVGQGWLVTGAPITLAGNGGSATIRVGDGTTAGASHSATIAAELTGSSSLVKNDLGTLILTGVNSYTGGTTIAAGTLQIGNGGTSGSIAGDVANNGTLAFNRSDATSFTGTISGSGAVRFLSGGVTLTAANSYTGGTTIAGGAWLTLGNGGTSGSIAGDVANSGTLAFNRSDATSFAGTISGSGAVRFLSGGVTLTAANSYTGGTTIANGASLTLGNGGTSGSIAGDVANSGAFAFNRSDEVSFSGKISGAGTLRQAGSGKTELTGDSSGFSGTTTVEAGTLAVNGQLGGMISVWTGGRLQGTGTVGNTIVSGTIAPGNSIGTLNVGNITFNAGSVYEVEVNAAGQSDRIAVSGTATINGGTVQVLAGSGNYAPQTQYTVLTAAGGRTGTFTGVTSNLAFLNPSLSYDASNVYLTMTRNDISFAGVGQTGSQIATGAGVESLGLGNAVHDAVLNLSAGQAQYAFDQLSGEIHASARSALVEDSRFLRSAVNERMRAAFGGFGSAGGTVVTYVGGKPVAVPATSDRLAVWGQGFGSWGRTGADGNAASLSRKTGGFFIGADAPVFGNWRLGAVAGYSRTDLYVKRRLSSGTSDNYHLGLYGGAAWGDLALRTGAAYTWHDLSTSRSVAFPGFGDRLKGGYDGATAQLFGELAYGFALGGTRFEPFASLAYVNLHTEGFIERGGAAALAGRSANTDATFTTLGLRAATSIALNGTVVTARGMVGWRHAFGEVTPLSTMRFASGGNAFAIGGVPIARNAAVIEAGLDYALAPNAALGITYGGQFGSGVTDQSLKANFNMTF